MQYPEKPTCHAASVIVPRYDIEWQKMGAYRFCSYCGSLHPEDLLKIIEDGAKLGGADWKYGWPHKFYVMFNGGTCKWYNEHLLDEGYDEEALNKLMEMLSLYSGILWFRNTEGKVCFRASQWGYQR